MSKVIGIDLGTTNSCIVKTTTGLKPLFLMFNVYHKETDLFIDRIHLYDKKAAEYLAWCFFGNKVYLVEVKQ